MGVNWIMLQDSKHKMKITSQLLDRYHRGECTPEELAALRQYMTKGDLQDLEQVLADEWRGLTKEVSKADADAKAEVWQGLTKQMDRPHRLRVDWKRGLAAAASIALLILAYVWWPTAGPTAAEWVAQTNSGRAPLELSLEDGTRVWLKPNSTLTYEQPFAEDTRRVRLAGEAFFSVTTDPDRPLLVATDEVVTKVLGTEFNVKAIPARPAIEVVLLEGKVAIEIGPSEDRQLAASLSPGESFAYQRQTGAYEVKTVTNTEAYRWQDGIIRFQRASLREVVETLEDWYDIDIRMEAAEAIEASLVHRIDTRKLPLEEVLQGIGLVAPYHFVKQSNNTYTVKPD